MQLHFISVLAVSFGKLGNVYTEHIIIIAKHCAHIKGTVQWAPCMRVISV